MANSTKAYASLTINLQSKDQEEAEGNKSISLELNDDMNVDEEGEIKSQFDFGEAIHIRCFATPIDMELNPAEITDGSVSGPSETATMLIEGETLTFQNSNTASTSKPILPGGTFTFQWLGKSLGAIAVKEDGSIQTAKTGTAVALITYQSQFKKIVASVPTKESPIPYPVIVSVSEADHV